MQALDSLAFIIHRFGRTQSIDCVRARLAPMLIPIRRGKLHTQQHSKDELIPSVTYDPIYLTPLRSTDLNKLCINKIHPINLDPDKKKTTQDGSCTTVREWGLDTSIALLRKLASKK